MSTKSDIESKMKEYLQSGGDCCPFCGSPDIEGDGEIHTDSGIAWQSVSCSECGEEWDDQYSLTSVEYNGKDYSDQGSKVNS